MELTEINPMLFILTVAIVLYLLQTLFIIIGTLRLDYTKNKNLPKISILVALRNEEQTLKACLESLLRLDYPQNNMEILLVNDRSHDQTPKIMEAYRNKSNIIKTINIKKCIEGLSGKVNAITQGIEQSSGELILVTDGDCRVPRTWAKAHAAYFTENVGLVGGFTLLDEKMQQTPLFGKIQSLDWAFLLSIGSGAMGIGKPLSVLGNNFSFRRQTYEEVGGYRNMNFTILEDLALMKTFLKKTSRKILYPIDPDMLVYSHPMTTLPNFYHQRKRWSAGGKEVGLYGLFLMSLAVAVHSIILIAFFALNPIYATAALCLKFLGDFGLLWRTTGLVNRRDLLTISPIWEIFYFVYTIFFTPVLLFPTTVDWKNISYSWKYNWKGKMMVEKEPVLEGTESPTIQQHEKGDS